MRRGIEVHRRIELHNRGQMPLEDPDSIAYDTTPDETRDAAPVRDAFSAFETTAYASKTPVFIETPIDIALPSGRARGRIDAVYATDDGWDIVDFKSGRPHDDPSRQIQLDAYAVAATDGVLGKPPDRLALSFVFLGGGDAVVETTRATPDYLTEARARLEELLAAISDGGRNRDNFPASAGDHCSRCDFLVHCREGTAHVAALREA
jgi:DNA helicase-2/ATP-dependent DNA helicase PcrA